MIYKFSPPNKYSLDNLRNSILYCRHYGDFNDPFEFWSCYLEGVPTKTKRSRRDVREAAAQFSRQHGLIPRSIRVADFANGWGACGPEGNVLINWHLIFAPKKVLEYVVVHKLVHLLDRSHGERFWNHIEQVSPDYRAAKTWLERYQSTLTDDFLGI